jgi:hypothetical protein
MESWNDNDFILFATKLRDYADRIEQLETLASVNGSLVSEDTRVLSVMSPDGVVRREVLKITNNFNAKTKNIINKIMNLPMDDSKAVLAALVEKIFKGDADGKK